MPGPRSETCAACYFWAADGAPDDNDEGECRRHAPRPSFRGEVGGADTTPNWPVTFGFEWCGE